MSGLYLTSIERQHKIKKLQKQMKEALLSKDMELYNSLYFDLQALLKYKI